MSRQAALTGLRRHGRLTTQTLPTVVDLSPPRIRGMRLSPADRENIVQVTTQVAGRLANVRLFGSRANDALRGGDIDLLVSLPQPIEHPALLSATLAARLERALGGRKVDVVLQAPNLAEQPIHRIALAEGILL